MSTFVLKGQWFGEAHTPGRCFKGAVADAGSTGMQQGDLVTVTFEGGQHTHSQQSDESVKHGKYTLIGMPADRRFTLVSFVRKDGGTNGEAEQSDAEQLWGGDLFTS